MLESSSYLVELEDKLRKIQTKRSGRVALELLFSYHRIKIAHIRLGRGSQVCLSIGSMKIFEIEGEKTYY
jgi:hypothetical protein